jgi:predicted PurR-regulated permease PerM
MWGFILGIYLACLIYPLFEEWRERRLNKNA